MKDNQKRAKNEPKDHPKLKIATKEQVEVLLKKGMQEYSKTIKALANK